MTNNSPRTKHNKAKGGKADITNIYSAPDSKIYNDIQNISEPRRLAHDAEIVLLFC